MRRLLLLLLVSVSLVPGRAEALTVQDIIELSKAGLGEDVLLALLEVDPSVFAIDIATLKSLKEAKVSERVIIAMVKSGRMPPLSPPAPEPAAPAPEPERQVIVIDHHDRAPAREVVVPVPVYVPVYSTPRRAREDYPEPRTPTRFIPTTGLGPPPPLPTTTVPEYWGSGGKLRPDAWTQPRPDTWGPKPAPKPDPKADPKPPTGRRD